MRLKPSICALIIGWALVYFYPVAAQEGKPQPEIEVTGGMRVDPDPILTESEVKTNKLPAVAPKEVLRDSIQAKVPKPLKSVDKVEKEEDPLSFNFLYYIIEKFKMSDIIE